MCPFGHLHGQGQIVGVDNGEQASRERYKAQDTWKNDTIFHRDSFELLENILEEAGELKERIPYEKLVTTTYSEKAAGLQNE